MRAKLQKVQEYSGRTEVTRLLPSSLGRSWWSGVSNLEDDEIPPTGSSKCLGSVSRSEKGFEAL
jgi:hypothetical protein